MSGTTVPRCLSCMYLSLFLKAPQWRFFVVLKECILAPAITTVHFSLTRRPELLEQVNPSRWSCFGLWFQLSRFKKRWQIFWGVLIVCVTAEKSIAFLLSTRSTRETNTTRPVTIIYRLGKKKKKGGGREEDLYAVWQILSSFACSDGGVNWYQPPSGCWSVELSLIQEAAFPQTSGIKQESETPKWSWHDQVNKKIVKHTLLHQEVQKGSRYWVSRLDASTPQWLISTNAAIRASPDSIYSSMTTIT